MLYTCRPIPIICVVNVGLLNLSLVIGATSRVSGVPAGRECSENFGGSAILALGHALTGNRGEYLRVVGIHSDG